MRGAGQTLRLMADLTEAVHMARGHTRLYVPNEPLQDARAALSDKARCCNAATQTAYNLHCARSSAIDMTCPLAFPWHASQRHVHFAGAGAAPGEHTAALDAAGAVQEPLYIEVRPQAQRDACRDK